MKILRKGDDFRKVSEKTPKDLLVVNNLISQGWNYCAKKVYKDFYKTEKEIEKSEKSENIEKITKATKKKIAKLR